VPLARFDPSCCWTKITPPIPMCNFPPFTFTHDSRVMSTICQTKGASRAQKFGFAPYLRPTGGLWGVVLK